jgi:hypothetical protein
VDGIHGIISLKIELQEPQIRNTFGHVDTEEFQKIKSRNEQML